MASENEQTEIKVVDPIEIITKIQGINNELEDKIKENSDLINALFDMIAVLDEKGAENTKTTKAELEKLSKEMVVLKKEKELSENKVKQLGKINEELLKLEKTVKTLIDQNQETQTQLEQIPTSKKLQNQANVGDTVGGYQYKNPRSKRKLNKNNRFGVLKTKSKSKSKKGKKKRKLGKGKKSMRGGMKKRTKSKRKSKNSKKTRKRRKKNKRK
tara:strand:+ start:207 stop:848 length:642 start_codon:yes stop_codon:yes gene_type:complete